jgi:hypothetical protein
LGKVTIQFDWYKEPFNYQKEKSYDQVWCVFDADPKPNNPNQAKNFNDADALAARKGFSVAYTNQAFEYWLILHFYYHQGGGMNRNDFEIDR